MLVELWSYHSKDSENHVLLEPISYDRYMVINGGYEVIPNKETNIIKIIGGESYPAYYLGDVIYNDDYNNCTEIVSFNQVKSPKKHFRKEQTYDDIPF